MLENSVSGTYQSIQILMYSMELRIQNQLDQESMMLRLRSRNQLESFWVKTFLKPRK